MSITRLAPLAGAIDALAGDGAGCAAPSGADADETMATGPDPIRSAAELPPGAAAPEECAQGSLAVPADGELGDGAPAAA